MSKVFVIGATGGIGKRLCPMLVAAGHDVTGLSRDPKHAGWYQRNQVSSVAGDMMDMDVATLTELTKGADVVVFSAGAAGSGRDRTAMIDGQGPKTLIEAMKNNGIKRVYLVSAFPEAGRTKGLGEGFEFYMETKKEADAALVETDLDWVILRPGTLIDEEGDGAISLAKALPYGSVKRGNVAKVLATMIDTPAIKQEIVELTDGSDAVDLAVAKLVRN
ncbi:NAD(P)H-binding protein [Rhodanobacter aciditrophus]|uniref:NAD(P)H-binding protein n=1 Tax=Rhodanobacter aciditrophus TaxID=1623218 RepID=A0ABW4B4Y0_9GAMM